DDGVAGGGNELLEGPLRVGDLAVKTGVPKRDGQVLGKHLEELALPGIDRASGRPVVDDEVPERPLPVLDSAGHDRGVGLVEACRRLGDDRDAVVAERHPELLGDGDRHTLWIELADAGPRDFAAGPEL